MEPQAPATRIDRPREWRSRLAIAVAGILLFETVTGLAIYLLPFSVTNQVVVIFHTAFGLLLLAPFFWYQWRHWRTYQRFGMTHSKLTGYIGLVLSTVCVLSGVVLTWQAVFGTGIGYTWRTIHLYSTFGVIAFVVPHIILLIWRDSRTKADAPQVVAARGELMRAERRFSWGSLAWFAAPFGLVALAVLAYRPPELVNAFPEDYHYVYGEDRPFIPSLARTDTNEAFDARTLAGSETCGTSGCHEQIVEEWSVSAHRWSAMDLGFQAIQEVMAKQNGPESTRYCGGCHDPISLFSGTKNIFVDDLTGLLGYQEGVSCLACHSILETDIQGNANYVVTHHDRYLFELGDMDQPLQRLTRDFLIRAYPRHHVASLSKQAFKTPEYCAACHKQFIDQEVNQVGWVQLQNQYDNWRKSRWNHPGDPTKTVECRECHMPLLDSQDPAAGDDQDYNRTPNDGKHRSHRFLAANQMMPALLGLPGAEEHIRLTEEWLRGEIEIPEIADKWAAGPTVSLELEVPDSVTPGEDVSVKAVVTSNKVGHDFPTGPLDIIQSWVELVVTDDEGQVVYQSGTVDEKNFIQPGSFIFKVEGVDARGNLIDRHNLWEMVGVRFRRSMFPGFSDVAEYTFGCPGATGAVAEGEEADATEFALPGAGADTGNLHVKARLRYRKIDQFLLNYLFGEEAGATSPITDMDAAEATIRVVRPEAARP